MKGGVDSEDVRGVSLEACYWRLVNWSIGQWTRQSYGTRQSYAHFH